MDEGEDSRHEKDPIYSQTDSSSESGSDESERSSTCIAFIARIIPTSNEDVRLGFGLSLRLSPPLIRTYDKGAVMVRHEDVSNPSVFGSDWASDPFTLRLSSLDANLSLHGYGRWQ